MMENHRIDTHRRRVLRAAGVALVGGGAVTSTVSADEHDHTEKEHPTEFVAELTGEAHGIETNASGRAHFKVEEHEDHVEVYYKLVIDCIRNPTMSHIHLGGPDEDGPIVVGLYPENQQEPELIEGVFKGTLAEGVFTCEDFVGPFDGLTFEEAVEMEAEHGTYVLVHTEQHPKGEIRGQIVPKEPVEEPP